MINTISKMTKNKIHNKELKGGEKKMEQPIQLMKYTCEKCHHSWLPRSEERPRVCPKCKSAWWDIKENPSNKIENDKKE